MTNNIEIKAYTQQCICNHSRLSAGYASYTNRSPNNTIVSIDYFEINSTKNKKLYCGANILTIITPTSPSINPSPGILALN